MQHAVVLLVFGCLMADAQVPSAPATRLAQSNESAKPNVPKEAERSLDAARRWTQAALDDSSNLPAAEKDILLVRLAAKWNHVDHALAEEYLTTAIDHLHSDFQAADAKSPQHFNGIVLEISSDVLAVDRKAWDKLMDELPADSVSEAVSMEAQNEASEGDVSSAMELERKSLASGGSENDAATLYSLITSDKASASVLFDQILGAAAKQNSSPNLLTMATQDAFADNNPPDVQDFFDEARQQRMLDLLAQRTLAGRENGACNYAFESARLFSRFPPIIQGQMQPVLADCQNGNPASQVGDGQKNLNTTDEIVQAMNAASDAKMKRALRQRAIQKAEADHDYERALHLCLDATEQERQANSPTGFDRFDNFAINVANEMSREALRKNDDLELQRLLSVLPSRIKPQVELTAARLLAEKDKPRALLILSDARSILEQDLPARSVAYFQQLDLTAKLEPAAIDMSWRILGKGLNNFYQASGQKAQAKVLATGLTLPKSFNTLQASSIALNTVDNESLVRAVIDDVNSTEDRACLRLGVIEAFLARYNAALKTTKSSKVASN